MVGRAGAAEHDSVEAFVVFERADDFEAEPVAVKFDYLRQVVRRPCDAQVRPLKVTHSLRLKRPDTHARRRQISRITRQGFPAARTPSGMSFVTTLPALMTERAPTRTPGQMIAPPPTQTSSPIETGFPSSSPVARTHASSG